jgi:FKBP-type peptidyl-prolyl cis-trans isomerase FkpA
MVKFVKRGGIAVGIGVLLGAAVVGWLRLHPADEAAARSGGGPVVLDMSSTPTPTPSPGSLMVVSPGQVSKSGGAAQTLLGGTGGDAGSSSGSSGGGSGGSGETNSWPGPDKFAQYDQYKDKEGALYGDQIVGTGAAVASGSVVTVNYRGWLTNGKLFDESYTGGKPFSFTEGANRVIAGWEQGLFGMKVGGRRRLIVPPSAGYGAAGHDPIPGNAVLVFDVELLEVK